VILMAAGVIFLLQNLGLVSGQIWGSLWQYWPVILILIGLELFLGGAVRRVIGGVLAGVIVVAAIAAIAVGALGHWSLGGRGATAGPLSSQTVTQALQDARSADVTVRFGAGSLNIGPLPNANGQLAQLIYDGPQGTAPALSYRVRNGVGQLSYGLSSRGGPPGFRLPSFGQSNSGQVDVQLNPDVPLTLNVQEGATDSRLDLGQLHVSNLELQTGASRTSLVLPASAGATSASIKGGAATIDVQVPAGVAAQIQYEGGLSNLNVDTGRFPPSGDRMYRSPDYDSAANKVDVTIQAGVATINIR
jgi:hypothetical protein